MTPKEALKWRVEQVKLHNSSLVCDLCGQASCGMRVLVPIIRPRRMVTEDDPCSLCKTGMATHEITVGRGTREIGWCCQKCLDAIMAYPT